MIKLYDNGVYLVNGTQMIEDHPNVVAEISAKTGASTTKEDAKQGTMAYGDLKRS